MRIYEKRHTDPQLTPGGQRAFYGYFGRRDGANQDVSFVLQINQPGTKTEVGTHDLEQWFFLHKGCVRFVVDGEEAVVEPGSLVYVPRNAVHHHEVVGDEPGELLVINHWPRDSENRLGWE